MSNGLVSFKKIRSVFISVPEVGTLIPLLILVGIVGVFAPSFFYAENIASILRKSAYFGIIAIGVSMVIITGSIDISVGRVATMGAIIAALCMKEGYGIFLSICIALICSGLIGFLNGFLVAKLKMNGFIVTIGTYYIAKGISFILTRGNPVYPLPEALENFGAEEPLGVSYSFLIFVILFLLFELIMKRTVFGRRIYATGDNSEVAMLAGINVEKTQIMAFTLTGVFAGLSGILLSASMNAATSNMGEGWELHIIAATAIGGVSLLGGVGTIIGSALGVIFMATLTNSLLQLGANSQYQIIIIGIVIIAAVWIDIIRRNQKLISE